MSSKFPNFALELLEKIARENGFNAFSMDIKSESMPGYGFSGEIFCIDIIETESSGKLGLVCKVAAGGENQRKGLLLDKIYRREALFYQHLMPTLAQFQEEKQLSKRDQFRSYPKCYGAIIDDENQQYCIVLENLRPFGFKMWHKNKPTTAEIERITMHELGKFHAVSIAFKDQNPKKFEEFKHSKSFMKEFLNLEKTGEMLENIYMKTVDSLKNSDHKEIMLDVKNNLLQFVSHCFGESTLDRVGVLCHGDFHKNNLLYRFNETDVVEESCLLDFQACYFGSPAIDIIYNIFTSTDKALRDSEYDNLIKVYYNSLSKTVKLLGSDPDQLFTYGDLLSELNRCGVYALVICPFIIQLLQADSNELRNLDEVFDKAADGEAQIDFVAGLSAKSQSEYVRRINEMLEDVTRLGYYANVQLVEEQTRL